MEATIKMMTNALRTGSTEAAIAFTSVRRLRSRPKSRKTLRALSACHSHWHLENAQHRKTRNCSFSWSKNVLYESIFYSGISTPNHIFSWNATKQPCLELLNFLSTPTLKGFLFTSECKRCVFENVLCLFWMVWKFSVRIKRKRALRESENQSKEKYDSNWERK